MGRWDITANLSMKRYLYVLVSLLIIVSACKSKGNKNSYGEIDNSVLIGKSFKNYSAETYSHSAEEYTIVISFPHERVCSYYSYGKTYWDDGDVDRYSSTIHYGYRVSGNKVILINTETDDVEYTFTYSGDNLTNTETQEVFTYNGTVEIDPELGKMIPPDGKRTYIPVGWYDSGYLENLVDYYASDMAAAGDSYGLRNLPSELRDKEYYASAVRIVDEKTLQTVYPAITTSIHDYYKTKVYGGMIMYYFYFDTYLGTYPYKVIDGVIFVRNYNGEWLVMGEYTNGSDNFWFGSINDELISLNSTFRKVNYNGGYDHE